MKCAGCSAYAITHVLVTASGQVLLPPSFFCEECAVLDNGCPADQDFNGRMACWCCTWSSHCLMEVYDPATGALLALNPTFLLDSLCEQESRLCKRCDAAYQDGLATGVSVANHGNIPTMNLQDLEPGFKSGYIAGYEQVASRIPSTWIHLIYGSFKVMRPQ